MGETIPGINLAGGRAARMGGGDKCLRPLAGRPILAHVIERLRPQVDMIVLNANGETRRFDMFGLEVVQDALADAGPLAGVLAGMLWAKRQDRAIARIVTVAADTPFFPRDLVSRLKAAQDSPQRIVQSSFGGRPHPTFALWPVSLAENLGAFLGNEGASSMRAFAGERHGTADVDFAIEGGLDPFFNINTPEDLEMAGGLAAEARR